MKDYTIEYKNLETTFYGIVTIKAVNKNEAIKKFNRNNINDKFEIKKIYEREGKSTNEK